MRFRILLIISLVFCSGSCSSLRADDSLATLKQQSNVVPALESLLLPGLGQVSRGEWVRGGFFLAAEGALALSALYYWQSSQDRPSWDDAGRIFDRDVAYGLATWYGVGAVFNALDAYYAGKTQRIGNPNLAAFQSVLFPGWGQLANGQRWKAVGMFAMQTGLAYAVYYQHNNYLYYKALGEEIEAGFYKDDRNRLIWWSVGAVIFSAADAFVDCHLRNWDVSDRLTWTPVFNPNSRSFGFGLRLFLSSP